MKTLSKVLVGAVLAITLAGCGDIALRDAAIKAVNSATAIRVGSVANARFNNGGWTLDGNQMVHARSKLLNAANFGIYGTSKRAITITDTAATITTALLSNFDVFFIGYMPLSFLGQEITDMKSWVSAGGVMIVTADDQFDNQVAAAFGYGMSTSVTPGVTAPIGPGLTHPVFSGPFGNASAIHGAGSEGVFTGNVAGQDLIGLDGGNGIYSVIEIPYGSGRVLVLADVDFLSDDSGMTADNTINPANGNDVFLGNVFAYEHK